MAYDKWNVTSNKYVAGFSFNYWLNLTELFDLYLQSFECFMTVKLTFTCEEIKSSRHLFAMPDSKIIVI